MSEPISGTLKVSNDCIADLAGYAALECYGVVGMSYTDQQDGVVRLLPLFRLRKGVGVSVDGSSVSVDLHVVVEQGVNIAQVSANLESAVSFILKQIAELSDVNVYVHIDSMHV